MKIRKGDPITADPIKDHEHPFRTARKAKRGELVIGHAIEDSRLTERGHVATVQLFNPTKRG